MLKCIHKTPAIKPEVTKLVTDFHRHYFLFEKNMATLLVHLADKDKFKWEMDEEITKGSLIVHNGVAVHPSVAKKVSA